MSFYSLGKNEAMILADKMKKIKDELKSIRQTESNVLDIRSLALIDEMRKIQAKLKVLSSDSDETA
jgi:hypothetical protein